MSTTDTITKDMSIKDVILHNEDAPMILMSYGMNELECSIAQEDTLENVAKMHGLEVSRLLKSLNYENQ